MALAIATLGFFVPLDWLGPEAIEDQSLLSKLQALVEGLPADKLVHCVVLAGLSWLGLLAACKGERGTLSRHRLAVVALFVGLVAYQFLIEVLQPIVASRGSELADVAAGTLGCCVALLLWSRGGPS